MSGAPSVAAVTEGLQAWVRGHLGDAVELVTGPEPVPGGLDTYIYRFEATVGGPLILRLYPSAGRGPSAERELAVLQFLDRVGYPAPRGLGASAAGEEVGLGLPFVVMEQLPGRTVLDRVSTAPSRAPGLLDSLAAAQASLHGIDPTAWPYPLPADVPESEIDRRLASVPDPIPPGVDRALVRALEWLVANAGTVRHEDPVICHQDFHPLNALVDDEGRLGIIDWENATIGDRHSDLARSLVLFEWAPVVAAKAYERAILRLTKPWIIKRYRSAYERHLPVDRRRLHYWLAFHAADSWWEASTLVEGTFDGDTRTDGRTGPAVQVATAMARRFARLVPEAAAARHYAP